MIEQKIVIRIDGYINRLYVKAYKANKESSEISYYAKLKPLAFIMLRTLILADYEIHKDSMPDRPEEIFSKKTLSRIVEKYEIEDQLKRLTLSAKGKNIDFPSLYHREFTGAEADWVLVAVWLWIEKRDMSISPLEYFKSSSDIFETSRLYIINKAESLIAPEFDDYFSGTEYESLVDKYDIMKGWVPASIKEKEDAHRELVEAVNDGFTKVEDHLSEQDRKADEHYEALSDEINEVLARQKGVSTAVADPKRRVIFAVLYEVKRFFDDKQSGTEGLVFDTLNNYFVITQNVTRADVIHKIRDVRDSREYYFGPRDLLPFIRAKNKEGKVEELSLETVKKYIQPSSGV